MEDAPSSMSAFSVQVKNLSGVYRALTFAFTFTLTFTFKKWVCSSELHSQLNQLLHTCGAFGDTDVYYLRITKTCSGSQGVLFVFFKTILLGPNGRNSALSVSSSSFGSVRLADDNHFTGFGKF